jgi:hypothetical protein
MVVEAIHADIEEAESALEFPSAGTPNEKVLVEIVCVSL